MDKINFILTSVLVMSLILSSPICAAPYGSGFCGGGMMYGAYGPGYAILGWITYLLVIALIIASIYWLIKSANKNHKRK